MYEKLASNELMLRSDGTVAVVVVVLLPPPQAVMITPMIATTGNRRATFMRTYLLIPKTLPPSSRGAAGRECAGKQVLLRNDLFRPRALLTTGGLSSYLPYRSDNLFGLLTNGGSTPSHPVKGQLRKSVRDPSPACGPAP